MSDCAVWIKDEQEPEIIQNKLKEFNEFTERNNKFEMFIQGHCLQPI